MFVFTFYDIYKLFCYRSDRVHIWNTCHNITVVKSTKNCHLVRALLIELNKSSSGSPYFYYTHKFNKVEQNKDLHSCVYFHIYI